MASAWLASTRAVADTSSLSTQLFRLSLDCDRERERETDSEP